MRSSVERVGWLPPASWKGPTYVGYAGRFGLLRSRIEPTREIHGTAARPRSVLQAHATNSGSIGRARRFSANA